MDKSNNDSTTTYKRSKTVEEIFCSRLRKTIGINWRRLRNDHGMTLYEFCRRSGINQSVAADIEACRHSSTSMDDCLKAAGVYGMTIETFLNEITRGVNPADPLSFKDLQRTDLQDVYPYNIITLVRGEAPDPLEVDMRGFSNVIGSLFEKERTVLMLRYRFSMSMRETANFLNDTTEGVRRREARALKKLRSPECIRAMLADHTDHDTKQTDSAASDSISEQKNLNNTKVDDLKLSNRTKRVVKRLGCNDTDDIARTGRDVFLMTRGCGEKAIREITENMQEFGYNW